MAEREEKLLHPNRVAVRDREAEDDGGAR
jgi:hypothetical protein